MSEPEQTSICPICQCSVRRKRMQRLYDFLVCRKCRNAFANRRQLAYIVDGACLWALPGLADAYPQNETAAILCFLVYNWIFWPLLFFLKDGFNGQSPGKWLTGVRVVDQETYEPINFGRSFKRNLVLIVPFFPLIVALQLIKGLRFGDKWANTRVIWKKYAFKPPFDIRGLVCTQCGYNLTGNVSGKCPECGKDVPAVPRAVPIAIPVS